MLLDGDSKEIAMFQRRTSDPSDTTSDAIQKTDSDDGKKSKTKPRLKSQIIPILVEQHKSCGSNMVFVLFTSAGKQLAYGPRVPHVSRMR